MYEANQVLLINIKTDIIKDFHVANCTITVSGRPCVNASGTINVCNEREATYSKSILI